MISEDCDCLLLTASHNNEFILILQLYFSLLRLRVFYLVIATLNLTVMCLYLRNNVTLHFEMSILNKYLQH